MPVLLFCFCANLLFTARLLVFFPLFFQKCLVKICAKSMQMFGLWCIFLFRISATPAHTHAYTTLVTTTHPPLPKSHLPISLSLFFFVFFSVHWRQWCKNINASGRHAEGVCACMCEAERTDKVVLHSLNCREERDKLERDGSKIHRPNLKPFSSPTHWRHPASLFCSASVILPYILNWPVFISYTQEEEHFEVCSESPSRFSGKDFIKAEGRDVSRSGQRQS